MQLKRPSPNVLLLANLHLFDRIHSNYVFKEEKKIVLYSNMTGAIPRGVLRIIALLFLMSETLKNTYEEVPFLSKVKARSLQLY